MQIDRILFPITTLGPGKRIGIWTVGCPRQCYKCSNPELWNPDESKNIEISQLVLCISKYKANADGITITGGEPFYQATELLYLIKSLKILGFNDVLVYSGYKYAYIKEKFPDILSVIDVLIDGEYIDELNDNKSIRGSSNQHIIIQNSNLRVKYKDAAFAARERQNFICNDKIISVGIPFKTN